jgi:hypothetical protein
MFWRNDAWSRFLRRRKNKYALSNQYEFELRMHENLHAPLYYTTSMPAPKVSRTTDAMSLGLRYQYHRIKQYKRQLCLGLLESQGKVRPISAAQRMLHLSPHGHHSSLPLPSQEKAKELLYNYVRRSKYCGAFPENKQPPESQSSCL